MAPRRAGGVGTVLIWLSWSHSALAVPSNHVDQIQIGASSSNGGDHQTGHDISVSSIDHDPPRTEDGGAGQAAAPHRKHYLHTIQAMNEILGDDILGEPTRPPAFLERDNDDDFNLSADMDLVFSQLEERDNRRAGELLEGSSSEQALVSGGDEGLLGGTAEDLLEEGGDCPNPQHDASQGARGSTSSQQSVEEAETSGTTSGPSASSSFTATGAERLVHGDGLHFAGLLLFGTTGEHFAELILAVCAVAVLPLFWLIFVLFFYLTAPENARPDELGATSTQEEKGDTSDSPYPTAVNTDAETAETASTTEWSVSTVDPASGGTVSTPGEEPRGRHQDFPPPPTTDNVRQAAQCVRQENGRGIQTLSWESITFSPHDLPPSHSGSSTTECSVDVPRKHDKSIKQLSEEEPPQHGYDLSDSDALHQISLSSSSSSATSATESGSDEKETRGSGNSGSSDSDTSGSDEQNSGSGSDDNTPRHPRTNYDAPKRLLNNIAGRVHKHRLLAVMGPPRAGKTLLLRTLAEGLGAPGEGGGAGRMALDGRRLGSDEGEEDWALYRGASQFVEQEGVFFENLTVQEHLEFWCSMLGVSESRIEEVLAKMDLKRVRGRRIGDSKNSSAGGWGSAAGSGRSSQGVGGEKADVDCDCLGRGTSGSLSGSERKRLGIAERLLTKPIFLFVDEPISNIDAGAGLEVCWEGTEWLWQLIRTTIVHKVRLRHIHNTSSSDRRTELSQTYDHGSGAVESVFSSSELLSGSFVP